MMKQNWIKRMPLMRMLFVGATFGLMITATNLKAATIFESGTLGPTGLPQGSVAATNVTSSVYTGVRFQLTQPVLTTQVGGHFVDSSISTFFGSIIALDNEDDFPDSGDLSTSDVLGTTELTFPVPSNEVFGDLNLSLDPGWYALVFGSGLFDTDGDGAAPRNNTDIGNPAYIGFQPGAGWFSLTELSIIFVNHRFFVEGRVVPEPSVSVLLLVASLFSLLIRKHDKLVH